MPEVGGCLSETGTGGGKRFQQPPSENGGDPKVCRRSTRARRLELGECCGVGNPVLGKCSSHQALPLSGNLTSSHILMRVSQFSLLCCSHCTCSVSRCPCLSVSDLDPVPSGLPLPPSCSLRQNSQPLCASVSPPRKWGKEQENKDHFGSKTKPETWRLFSPVFCHCVCYSGPAPSLLSNPPGTRPSLGPAHRPPLLGPWLPEKFPEGSASWLPDP